MNLSYNEFENVAKSLRCETEALMAVVKVETPAPHVGDTAHGPLILNERHWFYKLSGNYPVSRDYPNLSNRSPGGYCTGRNWLARQECEHAKLKQKMTIYNGKCREAALLSISMGLFQVMGFNHAILGYSNVEHMWRDAQRRDDAIDLTWFADFVQGNYLDDELRKRDWKGFARGYNGPAYARNRYDIKLEEAYQYFKGQSFQDDLRTYASIDLHKMVPYPPVEITPTGFPDFSQMYRVA